MSAIREFLSRIRKAGVKRSSAVTAVAMGRARIFDAYDVGVDTFIFERGISHSLEGRPSVLIVDKGDLRSRARGRIMTMTSGNHSVAAFPLLDGRFWHFSTLKGERRGEILVHRMLCANVVGDKLEISQRELATARLVQFDDWLVGTAGFTLADVVMGERNDATLEHYRRLGQEWRVKPLAWTEREMRLALAASKKRISAGISYFHSAKGVHFLTLSEFRRLAALATGEFQDFVAGLRELVSVFEGNRLSYTRMPKYRGHHEVEFFGIKRGVAVETLIPELEKLMEAVTLGRIDRAAAAARMDEIAGRYAALLTRPEFADESAKAFVDSMYMHITGEVYAVVGEGATPAFDDRRTALPGATFCRGEAVMHPGADARSQGLLENLQQMLSNGEFIEYVNIYELREAGDEAGHAQTREIVYKTNMRPVEASLVEKGLSSTRSGYGEYVLARVGALRALGVGLSGYYRLLDRGGNAGRRGCDFYIRLRCEGETLASIPESYFRCDDGTAEESREMVLGLATLMGDAAAQNLAMKKFDPQTKSPIYGVGKEIYGFEYDIVREKVVPKAVATCSIRGSLGWPCLDRDDDNLQKIGAFYFLHYAHALKDFQRRHTLPMAELAERFMNGFEFRIHAMAWQVSVMRDRFEAFAPPVPANYRFAEKWQFVMWSLERHERRLPLLRKMFFEKVDVVESEG